MSKMTDQCDGNPNFATARRIVAKLLADDYLLQFCASNCRCLLPNLDEAAQFVTSQLQKSLNDRTPWSLIRVGDGEGNALALRQSDLGTARALKYFNLAFEGLHGTVLTLDEAKSFAAGLEAAVLGADCVGFRSVDRGFARPEGVLLDALLRSHDEADLRALLGILSARRFLEAALTGGRLGHAVITSAWVHLGLLPYLSEILASAPDVLVLNGRKELAERFRHRLGKRLRGFIAVPAEGERSESHYRKHFPQIVGTLKNGLAGVLVLVGAGLIGKIYCHAAKQGGAVAVDLGSAFDVLANVKTRPIHRKLDFSTMRWL